ncbi:C40 family peptidase [Pseudothauera rhizosphaerae]|uniref:NlpC/P60 family protein n=1 Tax=Pseudothauera rhizosphaerae TaxID=2565932 RepID=A0A4S4AU25_9RHOO|nr:C40 family peptidase [Pseudothauera rhizosphaerae]THF63439.1 NlpC/P60 family protein [Pseudothauera rhizosphaerae]
MRPSAAQPSAPQLRIRHLLPAAAAALLSACTTLPPPTADTSATPRRSAPQNSYFTLEDQSQSREMVIFALGLLDVGYRFGGRNPEAGLDCSGMVSYIVEQVSGQRLPHNAAQIAERTRPIGVADLQPGDLVFFNTQNRRHSHMGVYMGDGRFIHAPSSRGRIRIERLDNPYFAQRIDGARSLLASN